MDFEFPDNHALNEVAKLRYMVATGDGVIPGSEIDKLRQRYSKKGVTHFSCTPAPEFKGTAEDLAKALNDVDNWLQDPVNDLVSRVGGHLFCKKDYIACTENTYDYSDGFPGTKVEPSKGERQQIREYKEDIELFEACVEIIKALSEENKKLKQDHG